jgi:hypothetical protein
MVVYRAMELDGNKKAQLVQMQTGRAKWIFFLCTRMKEVFWRIFCVDCIL